MSKLNLLIGYSFLLCSWLTSAQVITGLYDTTFPISGKDSESPPEETFSQALKQVLLKIVGDQQQLSTPEVEEGLKQAERFVQQYELLGGEEQLLSITFDEVAVKELISSLNLNLWSNSRPEWLAWIVLETQEKQSFVSEEEYPTEMATLKKYAVQRGLPILLPILDFEDLVAVTPTDIAQGLRNPILAATARYGAKVALTGWLFTETYSTEWKGQWRLYVGTQEFSWSNQGGKLENLFNEAIDKAISQIARTSFRPTSKPISKPTVTTTTEDDRLIIESEPDDNVPQPSSELSIEMEPNSNTVDDISQPPRSGLSNTVEKFELLILGVPDMQDYVRVRTYLQNLNIINELQILYIKQGEVSFAVTAEGGKRAVAEALGSESTLVPDPHAPKEMTYRYIP